MSDILRIKHKETKSLKKTLQLIMDQRSEIEHFVIEAIQDIANEKNDDSYTEENDPFDPNINQEDAQDQDSIPESDTPGPDGLMGSGQNRATGNNGSST